MGANDDKCMCGTPGGCGGCPPADGSAADGMKSAGLWLLLLLAGLAAANYAIKRP